VLFRLSPNRASALSIPDRLGMKIPLRGPRMNIRLRRRARAKETLGINL
jgi:hypothetical protein